jgi:2-polyprenyl-3-methyl-5-hydroxy-6-metoxy-1,4-benzoquinol methylase
MVNGIVRVLVVIASFGENNLRFLRQVIKRYEAMPGAKVIVLSDTPKDLPSHVTVHVGLPSHDPRSLPFAHQALFAANIERYDLFIYSEDDIGVTNDHIRAFLTVTDLLPSDEIAGFLRYEENAGGSRWMPDAHHAFHWKPESVVSRQGELFAEFTNEHAALYILTQSQLKRAIASGGYLRGPHEGRYDMLCTAATGPYTSCGFRKVICISRLDEFLIHHLSNRYTGETGLPLAAFQEQVETLRNIHAGRHAATSLCDVESGIQGLEWSKSFLEPANEAVLSMIPPQARTILSVGCGWGATELRLKQRGADVTALPLNSVIGAAAARLGVTPVYGSLNDSLQALHGRRFDAVFISNLLHLQRTPESLFQRCAALVGPGGAIVVDSPNFVRLPTAIKRMLAIGDHAKLKTFDEGRISPIGPASLVGLATRLGFVATEVTWCNHSLPRIGLRHHSVPLGRLTAEEWVFCATREADR